MTHTQEKRLLELTEENNILLKTILKLVYHDDANDFMTNVLANIVGNRIDGGGAYVQRSN